MRRTISEQADRKAARVDDETVTVSFEFLDLSNDYFFACGMDTPYYQKFFSCLDTLRKAKRKEFSAQTHSSLGVKSIFNTKTSLYDGFPQAIIDKVKQRLFVESRDDEVSAAQAKRIVSTAFEVSVGKNQGRLHGFLWDSVFHIVWIDPAHNLYCGGKPQGLGFAATVKGFGPEVTRDLQDKLIKAHEEIDSLLAK